MILSSESQPKQLIIGGGDNGLVSVNSVPVKQVLLSSIFGGSSLIPQSYIVFHGSDPNAIRPSYQIVQWYGTVEPLNAINGDIWFDIT